MNTRKPNRPHEFAPASGWLARAYYTPISDVLRGKLSAKLDIRSEIAAAGLPSELSTLIYTTVRRTRLWREEKLDVARELTAHFSDGLTARRAPTELINAFGPTAQAARLITRAKRRTRHWTWQSYWLASRLLLALLLFVLASYSLIAIRFYLSRPVIAHNYWKEINAARHVAEADRAWPLYREAALELGDFKPIYELFKNWNVVDGPRGESWNELLAVVRGHEKVLELIRAAASKPRLGFYIGDKQDRDVAQAAKANWLMLASAPLATENQELISCHLGGINSLRDLARLLPIDAWRALSAGEPTAAVHDIMAMLAISEQIFDQPDAFLIEQHIAIHVLQLALDTTAAMLATDPQLFTDAQLRDLAHRIAGYRQGNIAIDMTSE